MEEKNYENIGEAIVNGKNLSVSLKYAVALCNFIKRKKIDDAISDLEKVLRFKKAVPMKGEIAHKKGIMSGRYPIKGSKIFIRLLKNLKSNALFKGLEIEKCVIVAKADKAPRPYKRFGEGRMKRCHVTIKLIAKKK